MGIEQLDGSRVKRIWLIPYSHHDFAWVNFRSWHVQRYIKGYAEAAEVMEKLPGFSWLIDEVQHSWEPLERYSPETAEKIARLVKSGRGDVADGGWGLARPSYVGEETYIRNLMAGRRYFQKRFGIRDISTLFNADTACGHSQMPQIARLSGHRYYRFLRTDAVLTKKGVPFQFRWKGLDGSVVTVTRGEYGSLWCLNDWIDYDFDTRWEEVRQAFYDNWLKDKLVGEHPIEDLILFIGCDDSRPLRDRTDKPLRIVEFMDAWNAREPVKMAFGTLSQVSAAVDGQELPTWEGVLDHAELSYNLPVKGDGSMWRMRLELDRLLVRLERTAVIAAALGWEYPEAKIEACWKAMFEITGHALEYVMDKDSRERGERALAGYTAAAELLREAEDRIARAVPFCEEMQCVLINPLPRPVKQVVRLEATSYRGVNGFDVVDHRGNKLDFQVVDIHDGYGAFGNSEYVSVEILVEAQIPATGVTGLYMIPNGGSLKEIAERTFIDTLPAFLPPECADRTEMDNGRLRVVFYRGYPVSVTDTQTGRVVRAEGDRPPAELVFRQLPPAESWLSDVRSWHKDHAFFCESARVLANGPMRYVYQACGTVAGQPAVVTYMMDKDAPGIEIDVETDFREEIEGMLFSTAADPDGDVYADIPFGVEKRVLADDLFTDPAAGERVNPFDCSLDYPGQIYGRNWCSYAQGGVPLALISRDCSVYYILDRDARTMSLILNRHMPVKYRRERWAAKFPRSFDGCGKNHYGFSLMMNEAVGRAVDIRRYREERAFPAAAVMKLGLPDPAAGREEYSFFSAAEENIIGTALYRENGRLYARFFETGSVPTEAHFSTPAWITGVRTVDFEGNELALGASFSAADHTVTVPFGKYQIVTLEMEGNAPLR